MKDKGAFSTSLAPRACAAHSSLTLEPSPRRRLGERWGGLEPPLGGGWGSGAVSHAGRGPASAANEASALGFMRRGWRKARWSN